MGARRIFLPSRGTNTSLSQPRLLARADIGNAGDTDCGVIVAWGGGDSQKRRITVPVLVPGASAFFTLRHQVRRAAYASNTASAPFTASAESVTVFSSEPACPV